MSEKLVGDLNATVAEAVKARIEAGVLEALSGDQFLGRMVTAVLQQQVEVSNDFGYGRRKVTYVNHVIESVLKEAVKVAVERLVVERVPELEEAVRRELERSTSALAGQLVGSLVAAADKAYGISVELKFPSRH